MAQQTINVGSQEYAGDGESLRNALIKVNSNFTEVYADISALQTSVGNSFDGDYNSLTNLPDLTTRDLKGSVFADDSTLLVDAVNGKLIGPIETTSITNANDIDIASGDDVAIITSAGNNNYEWFFNSGGYLSFPTNGELFFDGDAGIVFSTAYDIAGSTAHINIRDTGSTAQLGIDNEAAGGGLDINVNGSVTILTDNDGTGYQWSFNTDGSLTFPDATVQSTAWTGSTPGLSYSEGVDPGDPTQVALTADIFDFGTGNTVDLQGNSVLFDGANVQNFAPGNIYALDGQYLYVTSAYSSGSATNVAFIYDTNISNVRQTFYGKTEFGNNGLAPEVDFTGATVTGLNISSSYVPNNNNHWNPPQPTTVAEALDRLASAIYSLNGGSAI